MWNIIGHRQTLAYLDNILSSGQPNHAYLFSGPVQIGKRTLMQAFAQALICQASAPRGEGPCGQCAACLKVQHGTAPDVSSLLPSDGKKSVGIDEIRQLIRDAALQPQEARYRIFLLPNYEIVTPEASNALLKTLEEPPQRTLLLLSTNNESVILSTILSRCQVVPMGVVAPVEIRAALIANFGQSEEQARLLGALAAGRPGWAISASQDDTLREQRLGWIAAVLRLCAAPNAAQRMLEAAKLAQPREQLDALLEVWLLWWREVLLVAEGGHPSGLLAEQHLPIARQVGRRAARGVLTTIQAALEQLQQNAPARTVLEMLVLEFPTVRLSQPA